MAILVNEEEGVWPACETRPSDSSHYPREAGGAISVHNFQATSCFSLGSFNSKPVIFGNGFVFPGS